MKKFLYIFIVMFGFLSTSVMADCTSNPASNVPTGNFSALAWTYSATGDACSNLTTSTYTGNVALNMANGATLTMNQSITINGNFTLTNQGTSTFYVPAGVTITVNGNLGDPTNNNFIFNIEGTLIVSGTLSGKNGNEFAGTGSVSAGTLSFSQAPTCPTGCPAISADNCTPAGTFCTTALPIELLSFSAYESTGRINLEWSTATEENNDYFSIERSRDGLNYELITTVPGAGNSTSVLEYTFIDKNPLLGRSYYRLKQTDFNGASETFAPIAVDFTSLENGKLALSPNPVSPGECISISTQADGDEILTISVFNMLGEVVFTDKFSGSTYEFDLDRNIKNGMYFVEISSINTQKRGRLVVK